LKKDDFVINTYAAYLLPRRITHILRVCLVGDFDWRVSNLTKNKVSEKEARPDFERRGCNSIPVGQLSLWYESMG
jgi:hypothetical protein